VARFGSQRESVDGETDPKWLGVEKLSSEIFTSFPGLYQMLPEPEQFSALDLFDVAAGIERGYQLDHGVDAPDFDLLGGKPIISAPTGRLAMKQPNALPRHSTASY
jgi:hypothetical protein